MRIVHGDLICEIADARTASGRHPYTIYKQGSQKEAILIGARGTLSEAKAEAEEYMMMAAAAWQVQRGA
jgi:hypothetical protein